MGGGGGSHQLRLLLSNLNIARAGMMNNNPPITLCTQTGTSG